MARHGRAVQLGDHVGERAAEAVSALRRLGLRPGVERVEGASPAQLGTVVSQEPVAGEEVARNAVITLYVGAPATLFPDDGEGGAPSEPFEAATPPTRVKQAGSVAPRAPRRRKQGHVRSGATRTLPGALQNARPPADGARGPLLPTPDELPADAGEAPATSECPPREHTHADAADEPQTADYPSPPDGDGEVDDEVSAAPPCVQTILTPLAGAPRRGLPRRWRSLPRMVRVSALVALCVLAAVASGAAESPGRRGLAQPRTARGSARAVARAPHVARAAPQTAAVAAGAVFPLRARGAASDRRPATPRHRRARPRALPDRHQRASLPAASTPPIEPRVVAAPTAAPPAEPTPTSQMRGGPFSP